MEFKRYLSELSNSDVEALLRKHALADDYDMAVGGSETSSMLGS
jgi:hypothetical protein